jgi:NAD(P)H dehydrogenase (quinone)
MSDAAPHPTLAVTGSTGWLGGLVARDLAWRGVGQRLLVREPSRAPELPGAEVRACAYADGAAAREYLEGRRAAR